MLSYTGLLANVNTYKPKDSDKTFSSLVFVEQVWSERAQRKVEQEVSIAIPARLAHRIIEYKGFIGKMISFNVRERTFFNQQIKDHVFAGYEVDGDGNVIQQGLKSPIGT